MKNFIFVAFVATVLLFPAFSNAAIPEPVVDAYEVIYGGDVPYSTKFTSKTTVNILGLKINSSIKGSGSQDAHRNVEGKLTMTMNMPATLKKQEKTSFAMDYKYFDKDQMMFVAFTKLPKKMPDTVTSPLRLNTWYSQKGEETITKITGENPFSDETSIEANEKYPAMVFKEKGSNKKEWVYTYSVDKEMISQFLDQQAEFYDDEDAKLEMQMLSSMINSITGSIQIDKKTSRPTKTVQKVSMTGVESETIATMSYGKVKDVVRPKKAIPNDVADDLFGGM